MLGRWKYNVWKYGDYVAWLIKGDCDNVVDDDEADDYDDLDDDDDDDVKDEDVFIP